MEAIERKWRKPARETMTAREWVVRQPLKTQVCIATAVATAVLLLLWVFVNDHDYIFIVSEIAHTAGTSVLFYKLYKDRSCTGLSLKSQELTALYLAIRIYCNFTVKFDIQSVLDTATLITTLWVIYMIRFEVKSSYMEEEDSYSARLVIACASLALLIHPTGSSHFLKRFIFAFGCNLETIAVLPQVRLMQKTKSVESLTAHYVFALGLTRFLNTAHWIIEVVNSRGTILLAIGYGLWSALMPISEIVQTAILADFCYYYVKSVIEGHSVLRLPSDAV